MQSCLNRNCYIFSLILNRRIDKFIKSDNSKLWNPNKNSFSYPVIKEVLNYHPLTLVSSSYSLLPLNNKWDAVLGRSAWKCTKQRHYVTNSLGPAILLTVNFTCRGMLCHKVGILRRLLLHRCNQITRQTKFTGHVVIILSMYLPRIRKISGIWYLH